MGAFVRFLAVGVLNTAAGYGATFGLLAAGASFWAATLLGTTLGLVVSFTLNRRMTFRHGGNVWKAAAKFAAASYACYAAAYGAAGALADRLEFLGTDAPTVPLAHLGADAAAALAGGALYTLLHFFALRAFVFNSDKFSRGTP